MLWRIEGTNTYLLGSIHVTNMNPVSIPPDADSVFVASDSIVFETDLLGEPGRQLFLLPEGDDLRNWIGAETLTQIRAHYDRLGVTQDGLLSMRPAIVAMNLLFLQAAKSGFLAARGIDRYLWDRSINEGKQRRQLETFNAHIAALTSTPLDEQASLLTNHAHAADVGFSELATIWEGWLNGDASIFEATLLSQARLCPRSSELMIERRNRNWLPQILEFASDMERRLIVVGALHMAGPVGIPQLLAAQGVDARIQTWAWKK